MDDGEGVRAERARRRRKWKSYAAFGAAAVAIDVMLMVVARPQSSGQSPFPPFAAITAAVLFVLMLTGGVWWQLQQSDELSYRNNLEAFTIGFLANASAFFLWWFMWLGGLATEPNAFALVIGSTLVSVLALGYFKLTRG
jgi:hypothetical protein